MFRNGEVFKFSKKFSNLDITKHIHQNFINMGTLEEDNLFLESEMLEEAEGDQNAQAQAPAQNPAPAQNAPANKANDQAAPAKNEQPAQNNDQQQGGENLFDDVDGGDQGGENAGGDDSTNLFSGGGDDGTNAENAEDANLSKGLPSDDQYYVVIIKDLNKKLIRLNDISLQLLSSLDENDAKIIERIQVLTYTFNRFIEQYEEYENPKVIILRLQKTIDKLIIFIDKYIQSKDGLQD